MAGPRIVCLGSLLTLVACGQQLGGGDDTVDDTFCIAEGTLVDTPDGRVAIESLQIGGQVWSVDPNTGQRVVATVTRIRAAQRECVALQFEGGELVCTPSHPLFDPRTGAYAPAGQWVLGERRTALLVVQGSQVGVRAVVSTTTDAGMRRVFDISVDHELHNFVAGGVVVHNKSIDPCYTDDGGDPYCNPPESTSTSSMGTSTRGEQTGGDSTGVGTGSDTGMGTDTGTDSGTGTTGATSTGSTGACMPVTEDASAVGVDCSGGAMCPDGYTCQPFNGVIFQEQCQILCEADCECPADHTCNEFVDKVAMWSACVPS